MAETQGENDINIESMLVSFIIPSYNSAHTVKRCLDSIYALSLKFDEFEVIFIDDCSTDNTCEVVFAYKTQYDNITLLKQPKNNRQGTARNKGLRVAKGEYICFVDSDDAVAEGIVEAIRLSRDAQTDMTAFHHVFVNMQGDVTKETEKLSFTKKEIFSGVEMQNQHPYWCSAPWGYIYNKAFLDRVKYPFCEGVLYEDSDFVMAHLYYANRMAYSLDKGYLVYYREGSTTHSISYKNLADYLLLGSRMLALYSAILSDTNQSQRMDDCIRKFAESVLDGACWNVSKACVRLIKLKSINEVRAFYDRVDEHANRMELYADKNIRKYYWSFWSAICLQHKRVMITLLLFLIPIYKMFRSIS